MDLRTYIEDNEEAWMWIYSNSDNEALNMTHVVSIRLQGSEQEVMILATTINEDEIVLHTASSGADARDWLKRLLSRVNEGDRYER